MADVGIFSWRRVFCISKIRRHQPDWRLTGLSSVPFEKFLSSILSERASRVFCSTRHQRMASETYIWIYQALLDRRTPVIPFVELHLDLFLSPKLLKAFDFQFTWRPAMRISPGIKKQNKSNCGYCLQRISEEISIELFVVAVDDCGLWLASGWSSIFLRDTD